MTSFPNSPEDALDRWLDDLADNPEARPDDELADAAAYLHWHFGLPGADVSLSSSERDAIRARVPASMPATKGSARGSGIVAGPTSGIPVERLAGPWRVASLVAAAVIVLIAAATLGAVLRSDNVERMPGAVATASVMPFTPQPALASATPVACVTDDILLLSPDEPMEEGAFRELSFAVAWYRDGVITVERGGKVLREIEVGEADIVQPTDVPNVILTATRGSLAEGGDATFVNIATSETADIGHYQDFAVNRGQYFFWSPDGSFRRWQAIDLRTFETADLTERFRLEPSTPWRPRFEPMLASEDGSTLLVGTAPYTNAVGPGTPITPITMKDEPKLDIAATAILIDGSLDDMRLVGPLAVSSGAVAISPDGETIAWLAPSETGGERILTIADVATGDMISERPVESTYANSLLYSADGTVLYSTEGKRLKRIAVRPQVATPGAAGEPFTPLEDELQIVAASSDRTKLLLSSSPGAVGGTSIWLDLATGETREVDGSLGWMFSGRIPAPSSPIGPFIPIDDNVPGHDILDMATGEIVTSIDRMDNSRPGIFSVDDSTLVHTSDGTVTFLELASGAGETYPAPEGAAASSWSYATTADGSCAAVSWLDSEDALVTRLYSKTEGVVAPLPGSVVGGWVPAGES
jgi:hypothetical protein